MALARSKLIFWGILLLIFIGLPYGVLKYQANRKGISVGAFLRQAIGRVGDRQQTPGSGAESGGFSPATATIFFRKFPSATRCRRSPGSPT